MEPATGLIECFRCRKPGGWSSGVQTVWYGVPCWLCQDCAKELGLLEVGSE